MSDDERGTIIGMAARGPREELRATMAEYNGRPYIDLRVWSFDNGKWRPTTRGVSVRSSEANQVSEWIKRGFNPVVNNPVETTTRPIERQLTLIQNDVPAGIPPWESWPASA